MKKAASILGMISSVISFCSGIYIYLSVPFYGGGYVLPEKYGDDAYTGIQNAVADTANNILHLNYEIQTVFGILLIIIGLLSFSYFLLQLANSSKPKSCKVKPQKKNEPFTASAAPAINGIPVYNNTISSNANPENSTVESNEANPQ